VEVMMFEKTFFPLPSFHFDCVYKRTLYQPACHGFFKNADSIFSIFGHGKPFFHNLFLSF